LQALKIEGVAEKIISKDHSKLKHAYSIWHATVIEAKELNGLADEGKSPKKSFLGC
jgi:hypothetical protein